MAPMKLEGGNRKVTIRTFISVPAPLRYGERPTRCHPYLAMGKRPSTSSPPLPSIDATRKGLHFTPYGLAIGKAISMHLQGKQSVYAGVEHLRSYQRCFRSLAATVSRFEMLTERIGLFS